MIDFLYTGRDAILKKDDKYILARPSKGGKTYAVSKIEYNDVKDDLFFGGLVTLNIGEAICHEEENFNKKLGRLIATTRMSEEFLIVTKVTFSENRTDITVENDKYEVELSFKDDKKFSRLEYIYRTRK